MNFVRLFPKSFFQCVWNKKYLRKQIYNHEHYIQWHIAFVEVSKYPSITRDISFIVNNDFVPNNYFDLVRDIAGDLVEQVELLDKYQDEKKFGKNKVSYTYRVVYRSADRTLKTDEVDPLQNKLYQETKTQFNAELR